MPLKYVTLKFSGRGNICQPSTLQERTVYESMCMFANHFFFLTLDQGLSFLVFGCSWNERLFNLFPAKEMLIFLFNSAEPSAFALLYKEVLCFLATLGEVEGSSFWTVRSMTPLLVLPTAGSRTPKTSLDSLPIKQIPWASCFLWWSYAQATAKRNYKIFKISDKINIFLVYV